MCYKYSKHYFLLLGILLTIFVSGLASASIIYVDKNVIGMSDGLSWSTAYTDIQTAVDTANPGDEVWVAKGTYVLTASIALKDGVNLRGGFNGENDPDERAKDPAFVPKIDPISGKDVGQKFQLLNDTVLDANNDTSIPIIIDIADENAVNEIDGFTLTNLLYSNTAGSLNNGAVRSLNGAVLNMMNMSFLNNRITTFRSGAGVSLSGSNMVASITNSNFEGNISGRSGHAIFIARAQHTSVNKSTFINNTLEPGNALAGLGGAIQFDTNSKSAIVNQSYFEGNENSLGGAISFIPRNGVANVTKSVFLSNKASIGGALIVLDSVNLTASTNYYDGNIATGPNGYALLNSGGSVYVGIYGAGCPVYSEKKSVYINNSSANFGGAVSVSACPLNDGKTHLTMEKVKLEGNQASQLGGGIYINTGKVNLCKLEVTNNTATTNGGGLYAANGSNIEIAESEFDNNNPNDIADDGTVNIQIESNCTNDDYAGGL